MRWRRCVWCSLIYFLWLTHWEWLQDILPSSSSTTSSSSWLTHSTPRPHLYTDTIKETQLQRERIKFLICPCLLFQRRLPLPLSPPLSPSNLSLETRDTPNFTLSLFPPPDQLFCGTDCVTGPFSVSQEIPHPAKVTAGKDAHSCSSAGSRSPPHCRFLFGHFCPFFKKQKPEGRRELAGGKHSIHPILGEQAKTVRGRWWKTELLLCHASSSSRNLKSQHVSSTIKHLSQTLRGFAVLLYSCTTQTTWYSLGKRHKPQNCRRFKAHYNFLNHRKRSRSLEKMLKWVLFIA